MSGGGTGLMSGGGWSTISGTPGGRGMSGFFGCSIMNLKGATALPLSALTPVRYAAPTESLVLVGEPHNGLGARSAPRRHGPNPANGSGGL